MVLSYIPINAQPLTGLVYDKATKKPVFGAYVYLDGTSFVNVTTNSGEFTLAVNKLINTKLVLSHLAYQTVIIENPFLHLPDTIYMEEQLNTLNEVVVRPDRFSRQQKLRAFKEQFLRQTEAGKSCKILNEDDIQIWFNVSTKTLIASSGQPIEVINEYLGYRVLFNLVDFKAEYSNASLNRARIRNTYYAVTTSFTDLRPDDKRIKMRRDDAYGISFKSFFRSLAYDPFFSADTSSNPVFWVYERGGSEIDFSSYFIITDTLSLKAIHIPGAITEKGTPGESLLRINVSHRDREKPDNKYFREYSNISFFTNNLIVDQYGNIDQGDKVVYEGLMGFTRAGDMLPIDYVP